MTTTAKNILIAKFIGAKLPYKNKNNHWEFYVENAGLVSSSNLADLNGYLRFNYHKDWNRLMQVIQKIEVLEHKITITTNILEVYDEVFKFIKQYKVVAKVN